MMYRAKNGSLALALASFVLSSSVAGAGPKEFTLVSADMAQGKPLKQAQVFRGMGCDGGNISPQLSWQNAPAGTKSFVLAAYDPDAPTGSGWWHWVVYNIPATVTALEAGASTGTMPAGAVQGLTDFGKPGFGGACPPKGDKAHRYIFTLYALKTAHLDLPASATPAMVGFNARAALLGKATLTATYGR